MLTRAPCDPPPFYTFFSSLPQPGSWHTCIWEVMFPLLDSVKDSPKAASKAKSPVRRRDVMALLTVARHVRV